MSDINEVWVSGRLTVEPEKRETNSGVSVCDLNVASNRYGRKDENGNRKQYTTYVRVTLWGKQADVMSELLHTGDKISVIGQLFDDNFSVTGVDGTNNDTTGRLKVDNVRSINLEARAKRNTETIE